MDKSRNESGETIKEILTGLHDPYLRLRLELFTTQLLAINLLGHAERTAIPLLTKSQAIALRELLDELIPYMEPQVMDASFITGRTEYPAESASL